MNPGKIAFYRPFTSTSAKEYLLDACGPENSLFSGKYHQRCSEFIRCKYGCEEMVLTSSCTDALTMASLILGLKQDDEVIIPAYTFTSVANVFANRGIKIRLADSQADHPNMDPDSFSSLIGPATKAVVFMSYGGQSPGIEQVAEIAKRHKLYVIEDAAHSFDSLHKNKYVGTFGDLGAFSFHETKSVSCGQGGLLMVNNRALADKVASIRDHGTNRRQFLEGRANEYHWTSPGGEFNLPELSAALLHSQFRHEAVNKTQRKRLWDHYYDSLLPFSGGRFELPPIGDPGSNFYIFYLVLQDREMRKALIAYMKDQGIDAAFHYTGLHHSPFFKMHYEEVHLPHADWFSHCLVRLPLYPQLDLQDIDRVCSSIKNFYTNL